MPVVGLHDYEKKEDDEEKKQNELYTGGNRQGGGGSGLSVIGPPAEKDDDDEEDEKGASQQVGKMFLRAQEQGDELNEEAATLPKRQITMYRNGFTVDDGPFRSLEDPTNLPFLRDVSRGLVPRELEEKGQGAFDLELVDRRGEVYTNSFRAFTGQGQSLGTTATPEPSTTDTTMNIDEPQPPPPPVNVDPSQPTTQIQVRLATGNRIRLELNHSHTVAQIELMVQAQSGPTSRPFHLLAGYPPKALVDKQLSIADAGLLNASLTQKLV